MRADDLTVAIVTPYYRTLEQEQGGVGSHYTHLAESLAERGVQVHVVYIAGQDVSQGTRSIQPDNLNIWWVRDHPDLSFIDRISSRARKWIEANSLYKRFLKLYQNVVVARKLHYLKKHYSIQLVETTNYQYMCLLYLFFPGGVPLVTRVSTTTSQIKSHSNEATPHRKGLIERLEELMIRLSHSLVTHTHEHALQLSRDLNMARDRFSIIPHGIELPKLFPSKVGKHLQILYVGFLNPRKGIDVLLDAIPSIIDRYPGIVLHLAGRDENDAYRLVFEKRWGDRYCNHVKFLQSITNENLVKEYTQCDFVVVPSRYESFGLVYVEAMSYGKPVIGTTAGGIPEVVSHGETGLLTEPGNVTGLQQALSFMIENKAHMLEMGRKGRLSVEERFSREKMALDTIGFYRRVLETATPSSSTTCSVLFFGNNGIKYLRGFPIQN